MKRERIQFLIYEARIIQYLNKNKGKQQKKIFETGRNKFKSGNIMLAFTRTKKIVNQRE